MALRTRLILLVVIGLLLIAASVVYTRDVPWPGQGTVVTGGHSAGRMLPSHAASCRAGGGSCGTAQKGGGGCSVSGGSCCAMKAVGDPKEARQAKMEACAKRHAEAAAEKAPVKELSPQTKPTATK